MREFIKRALQKTSRMNPEQVQNLLSLVTEEYETLDAVLDSIGTGVIVCDSSHFILQTNKAAIRILPMEFHDLQEKPVWSCILDPDLSSFVRDSIEREETVQAQSFFLDELSGTRFLSIGIVPLVRSKRVRGTIITVEDVTDRKTEEMKNRRLESLASLTNLAATVAHEIKNPLGSMSIYVQLIRKALSQCETERKPQVDQYLDVVNEEIERLNKIVVDFLFAVRPLKFEFSPLSVNDVVRDVADFFGAELSQANISLVLDLAEPLPLIKGDERFIRQMLVNLVKNSMAAMKQGGEIRAKTWASEDSVYMKIEDTGSGIPQDVLQKIFEPYFTTKVDGTGLGLTMAYKVVKEHGGDIRVQSELNKGTCFTITLPILRKAQRLIECKDNRCQ